MIYENVKRIINISSSILFPWMVKNYIRQLEQATKMTFHNQFDQTKTLNMSSEFCIIIYVIQLSFSSLTQVGYNNNLKIKYLPAKRKKL